MIIIIVALYFFKVPVDQHEKKIANDDLRKSLKHDMDASFNQALAPYRLSYNSQNKTINRKDTVIILDKSKPQQGQKHL